MNYQVILILLNLSLVFGTFHHHHGGGSSGSSYGSGSYGSGSGSYGSGSGSYGSGSGGGSAAVSDSIATPPPSFDILGYQPPVHVPAAPESPAQDPDLANPEGQDSEEAPEYSNAGISFDTGVFGQGPIDFVEGGFEANNPSGLTPDGPDYE